MNHQKWILWNGILGILFLISSASLFAESITMTVSDTCGYSTDYLEVVIWNPPGGTVLVNEDKTITVDVPEGTKLAVDWNGDPNIHPIPMGGPWTPAINGGVLPVYCTRRNQE